MPIKNSTENIQMMKIEMVVFNVSQNNINSHFEEELIIVEGKVITEDI